MFDENNHIESDLMMRSILSEAQEEVPAHVWDGVYSELDRISAADSKKPAVIWIRRTAVAVAAAAAVTVGVIFNFNHNENRTASPAEDSRMIAVVEENTTDEISDIYIADAGEEVKKAVSEFRKIAYEPLKETRANIADSHEDGVSGHSEGIATENEITTSQAQKSDVKSEEKGYDSTAEVTEADRTEEYFSDEDWEADEDYGHSKVKASLVISGITGTNNPQNKSGIGPMKSPAMSTIRPKTGIKQTSNESTFGVPLSFGLGTKIDFNHHWSLGLGLNYSLLTRRFEGTYTRVGDDGNIEMSTSSDIRNSQSYIGIPINVYYNIIGQEHLNFYTYVGGTVEKCIADKYNVLSSSVIHTEKVEGAQLSANVGIGVEFFLGKHLGLYIDPSLRYYFNCRQPKSIRTEQPLMLGFEMGLRFRL